MKNPKSVLTFAVALLACVPGPLRKAVLLALAGIIRSDARFAGLSAWAVPELLEGVDSGIEELLEKESLDATALREALFAKLNASAKGQVLAATKINEGAAFVSRADGGLIHRANCTECGEAHKAGDPYGQPEMMFKLYGHRGACPKCWEVSGDGKTVTVKTAAAAPAAPSIVDALVGDTTGDIGRALHLFEVLLAARRSELINVPTQPWHLALAHQKGLTKNPKALALLPKFTEPKAKAALDALDSLKSWPKNLINAKMPTVIETAREFGPYIAEIRAIVDKEIFDGIEWFVKAVDYIDDRIDDATREKLIAAFQGGNIGMMVLALCVAYVNSYAYTTLMAVGITFAVTAPLLAICLAGVIPLLGSGYYILVRHLTVPSQLMYVGWCLVFVPCAACAGLSGFYRSVKARLQGWIPGEKPGFFTGLVTRGVFHLLAKWNLVPAESQLQPKPAEEPSSEATKRLWLTISVAASILTLAAMWCQETGASQFLTLMVIVLIGLIVEWGRRFHYLFSWEQRIGYNKTAVRLFATALIAGICLVICSGVASSLLGRSNLDAAHQGIKQEFGELVGAAGPDNYPRGSQAYCEVYPQDNVCGGWKSDAQVLAEADRRAKERAMKAAAAQHKRAKEMARK
jgi:hypothetical protein